MTTSEAKKGKGEGSGLKMTERMLKSRTVLLSSDVSPSSARRVIEQLLVLEADDPDKPITLVVNSPGGDVHSGFAIYDVIRFIRPEVRIVCSGLAASIATVVLLAADKKNRLALPNCRLLLHQPLFHGEVFGPASDLEITANEIIKTKEHINVLTGCHFSLFADHGPDHVAYRIGCNSRNDVALPIRRWALDVRCWKFVPCVLALGG